MTIIGIISDTHDNIFAIKKAMSVFRKHKVNLIIHCGDIVAPKTIEFFKGIPASFVLGNCDGDIENITKKIQEINGKFLGNIGELKIDNKTIIVFHGHDPTIMQLLKNKNPDYLLTGHTHIPMDKMDGKTRILNPGGHYMINKNQISKVIILDLKEDTVEFVGL